MHFSEIDDVAELFRKVGVGSAAGVQQILQHRPELSRCRNLDGLSVVRFAHYMREQEVLKLLIAAGPPLDIFEAAAVDDASSVADALTRELELVRAHDASGETALHVAAANGSARVIDALVSAGASLEVRSRDERAQTALHRAVEHLEIEASRALLRHGCDPNATRSAGTTILMTAAAQNSRDIVEMLVARNVNCDARNDGGKTASDIAAARGHLGLAARIRLGERYIDRRTV